jgi:hypothetical protein
MTRELDGGDLAGLSAALAYYFVIGSVGLGILIWRYRARFNGWWSLSSRDRADAILHLSMFGIMLNAAFQRIIATYSFAAQEWRMSPVTVVTAPLYLAWSLIFTAAFLWWLCMEIFGPSSSRVWWISFIVTGAWLGAAIGWRY